MRNAVARWVFFACPLLALGCTTTTEADRCAGVTCDRPPADACLDGDTALHYLAKGQCQFQTGQCEYGGEEENCDFGCAAGRCLAEDKCRGVVCDHPPSNECRDADHLKIYEAIGDCASATGQCEYPFREVHCANGCLEGRCQDENPCLGVTCDDPPDNTCLDEATLVVYDATGTCNQNDGRCQYASQEQTCEVTCHDGACLTGKVAWGYVGILESPDVPCFDTYFEWCDPVRAYFATDSCHTLVLPHHLDAICTKLEKQTLGGCTLYTNCDKGGEGAKLSCAGGCAANQECVGWYCKDLPPTWDVGTITIEGLKFSVHMNPDAGDRYGVGDPPPDMFDAGDPITVQTGGGDLEPLSLSATGVADLEIDSPAVSLEAGQPVVIRWTPADPDAQVQVLLYGGWHFPLTPTMAIVCEAPDDAGQIEVPAVFVDRFREMFMFLRHSRITRFTRRVITPYEKDIELFVGHARLLTIANP